jgi:hypothetical protein
VIITHPRKVETGIDLLDFPTLIWMAIDYSVYTVLQASRRSWRIGQTVPVKVFFYAYEETIQEDALRLVAAKVAAALRVNGDTVGDDSLAELDDLTSGDLVATLARIVTGEAQIEVQSLQQAFAEANVGLRQANTLIGEYTIVDEEDESLPELEGVPQQQLPLASNGQFGNGFTHQPSLFSSSQVRPDDTPKTAVLNGKCRDEDSTHLKKEGTPGKPPVPRPRLVGLS